VAVACASVPATARATLHRQIDDQFGWGHVAGMGLLIGWLILVCLHCARI
jgi:hypothetical protein